MPAVKKSGHACGGSLLHIVLTMARILAPAAISVLHPGESERRRVTEHEAKASVDI